MKSPEQLDQAFRAIIREATSTKDVQAPEAEEGHKTYQFNHPDHWHMQLFIGLCKSFGVTVMRPNQTSLINYVKCEASFFSEVVMPVFVDSCAQVEGLINEMMEQHLEAVSKEIVVEEDQ